MGSGPGTISPGRGMALGAVTAVVAASERPPTAPVAQPQLPPGSRGRGAAEPPAELPLPAARALVVPGVVVEPNHRSSVS